MFEFFKEVYYVMWGDLIFMKHHVKDILISSIMSPLLYLIAFGFGVGMIVDSETPYIAFVIPGIVALTALSASFTSTSTRMNVQRLYYRSFDEMMMCPLGPSSIIVGKAMLGLIRGIFSTSIIFAIGLVLVPEYIHLTVMYVVCVMLACFTFSLLGVTAALVAKSHQSMSTFSSLIVLPMTFLCGTFFSVDSLPSAFQAALYVLPLTHSSVTIRASALGGEFPWISLFVLACFCTAFYIINLYLVKNKKV